MKKWGLGALVVLLITGLVWALYPKDTQNNNDEKAELLEASDNAQIRSQKFTVWNAYWDQTSSQEELDKLSDSVVEIIHFAGYFDSQNAVFVPEATTSFAKTSMQDSSKKHILSFVNDKINEDKTSSLKDTQLLYTLLESVQTRKKHIESLINITLEYGFDGIEIDYENIKKDTELWNLYSLFIKELNLEILKTELSLRVVLEPSAPFESLQLPEGPRYVIMAYNLFGYGTEPGPKADEAFLIDLVKRSDVLPGDVNVALATGGFDWVDNKPTPVTHHQAREILDTTQGTLTRDLSSNALKYKYINNDGKSHELWYSDVITLNQWIQVLNEQGITQISIWKLGGNQW